MILTFGLTTSNSTFKSRLLVIPNLTSIMLFLDDNDDNKCQDSLIELVLHVFTIIYMYTVRSGHQVRVGYTAKLPYNAYRLS